MSLEHLYQVDLSAAVPPVAQRVADAGWVPSRVTSEAHTWPLLHLAGHPPRALPPHIVDAASAAAAAPFSPESTGWRPLREAIARSTEEEWGRPIDPDRNVVITNGSSQALVATMIACCTRTAGAICHAPAYFYADMAQVFDIPFRWADGSSGAPDWEEFAEALKTPTAVALVNTPCNPTGYVFTDSDIGALAAAVRDVDCWIVSDEAYLSLVYGDRSHLSPARHPELADRTLVIRSFSKTYSMAPWRLGYAVGPTSLVTAIAKVQQWLSLGVDCVAQAAGLAAIEGPQGWLEPEHLALAQERFRVADAINQTGVLAVSPPQAGALAWARIVDATPSEDEMVETLGRQYGIPAVPGRAFGPRTRHVRIPFGAHADTVDTLVTRLGEYANANTPKEVGRW